MLENEPQNLAKIQVVENFSLKAERNWWEELWDILVGVYPLPLRSSIFILNTDHTTPLSMAVFQTRPIAKQKQ